MDLTELCQRAHAAAIDKGFYDEPRNFGELIALCHSELSEALEAHRHGRTCPKGWAKQYAEEWLVSSDPMRRFEHDVKDSLEDEIADAFIRLGDLCGYLEIDIDAHIRAKMLYNEGRPRRHGKRY